MIIEKKFDELTLKELFYLLKLREEVFILEQHILAEAEIDEHDFISNHYFIKENEQIVAYLRVFPSDGSMKLGRLCTKKEFRKKGYAKTLINHVQSQYKSIIISAQYIVKDFYQKLGFKVMSKKYKEAGIDHIKMVYLK